MEEKVISDQRRKLIVNSHSGVVLLNDENF